MERQYRPEAVGAVVVGGALKAGVRAYQLLVSPLRPPCCRFLPTCSDYAIEAIARYGAWRGSGMALWRLARCHPWGGSGYDPVPTILPQAPESAADPAVPPRTDAKA